jgi:predicted DsbA family dithiol-disulfide isomerase
MERVKVLVDPRSPWCFQNNRWLRALERLGRIDLDWGLFSLEVVNLEEHEDADSFVAHYGPAFRTAVLVRERSDSKQMGHFLSALGSMMWVDPVPDAYASEQLMHFTTSADAMATYRIDKRSIAELSEHALAAIGMDPALVPEAMANPATWRAVVQETRAWGESHEVFGAPTLVFDAGEGPAVFGPVFMSLPSDEQCLEAWDNLSWMVSKGYVFELKKKRNPSNLRVDLPNSEARTALRVALLRDARPQVAPGGEYAGHGVDWMIARLVEERAAATAVGAPMGGE